MNRGFISIIVTTLLFTGACRPVELPQAKTPLYFPQTGHTVEGLFRQAYEAYGRTTCLGYPISQPYAMDGMRMQLFQFARMEEHPENSGKYRVELSLLGDMLQRWQPPLPAVRIPAHDEAGRRFYPQTGHSISHDFLEYFDACGGIDRFGYPLSEPFFAEDMLVQDFQRGRLRWLENSAGGGAVIQEQTGLLFATREPPPAAALLPVPQPAGAEKSALSPAAVSPGARLNWHVEMTPPGLLWLKVNLRADHADQANFVGEVRLIAGDKTVSMPLPPTDPAGETQVLIPMPDETRDMGMITVELGGLWGKFTP